MPGRGERSGSQPIDLSLAVPLCIMQTSVLDRVEAESVTVMPLVAGGDEHIYAHDIRTGVARVLVGLPFALARLIEAISRSLASKSTRPCR